LTRAGENLLDSTGRLIRNVGGDVFQPHRDNVDPETIVFLDGTRTDNLEIAMRATWECINQIWVDAFYAYQNAKYVTAGTTSTNSLARLRVRMEL
jgi:hypothetical protein